MLHRNQTFPVFCPAFRQTPLIVNKGRQPTSMIQQGKEFDMAASELTRKAINQAFLEILEEKPLEKITVRDITDRCGINRNTFYYHYQDVPALLEDILSSKADQFVLEYPRLTSIDECLTAAMEFARANKRVIMHIFSSGNHSNISSLWRICEHVIRKYAETVFPDAPLSDNDKELFIRYHKCACFGLIIDWLQSGMKEEYVEDMHRICRLKKGSAELIIENALEEH